jgi:glycosyltransferase involved in cell wall biosynthesis
MAAPEPVFSPRGTPISVINRCRALTALGHDVDLVTYPLGADIAMPGLRYLRARRLPGIDRVRIGPSFAKVLLDVAVFVKLVGALRRGGYDVLHTHEEAGAFGWWLRRITRLRHVHDMHNDLAMVLTNYGFSEQNPLTRGARWLERRIVRSADSVIVIFPELGDLVRCCQPSQHVQLVHNVPLEPPADASVVGALREAWAPKNEPLVVYTGTLEPYQGMPMLVEAMAHVGPMPDGRVPRLVVVGGRTDQIDALRRHARACGIEERVIFVGLRPPDEVGAWLAAASVVVSTRSSGTNIPLKVYSYLRCGKPIVATRIRSHTQVLDDTTALLVDATPTAVASGVARVLHDPALASRLADAASATARARYSTRAYVEATACSYAAIGAPMPSGVELDACASRLEQAL